MKDNMFKLSLRLFGRVLWYMVRQLASPFILLTLFFFVIFETMGLFRAWVTNDEKRWSQQYRELELTKVMAIHWFTF